MKNIGIIIVDEEHDSSYKQNNSPRYNGRDAALVRAKINNAVIILGSATPSLESYYNMKTGKYQLLSLTKRATNIKLPDIEIVDLKTQYDRKELKTSEDFLELIDKTRVRFLSKKLIYLISERIDKKESVILLQNRRGYHSYIECLNCGNVEMCIRCNISLTYHKIFNNLKCHYCGFSKPLITKCSNCGSAHLIQMGTGTEKVEEELIKLFPKAVIKRVDSDYITSAKKYQEVLNDFYNKKIDVLVGTQLLSKGLDFPNVTLVGVINADIGLLYPDFRASERTFQILTQVAGRSGRDLVEGEVLIQTNHSEYEVFKYIKTHDYINFYDNEIKLREKTLYPPYSRIALIEMKSMDRNICESKIKEIYNFIRSNDKNKILDLLPPNPPLFFKQKDYFRYHLLIKSPKTKDKSGNYLLSILHKAKEYADKNFPQSVRMIIDMDAIDLL